MERRRKLSPALGAAAFCLLAALLALVWLAVRPAPQAGGKHITVTVIHADGTQNQFTYDTDEEYLGGVLLKEGLIQGSDGPYGLYVETVDGETVDYGASKSWWNLSVNGEYAQTGADATPIRDGDTYTWTYTIG